MAKKASPFEIELPYPFSKVFTEDDVDIGRKLDIGNDFLGELTRSSSEILRNTSALHNSANGSQ